MRVRPFHPILVIVLLSAAVAAPAGVAVAQAAQSRAESDGRLTIEVRDTLGGVLPGATVTVLDPAPDAPETAVVTDVTGTAQIAALPPGRYRVRAELPGFRTVSADVAVTAGRGARRVLTLPIDAFEDEVTVTLDSVDRRLADSFTETLVAGEIDQLPDDPEEAAALLAELAGPDAEIRVNGFEDGELPPASQIQAIRIRHDPFAPDSEGPGRPRVDVITRPGTSRWEHQVNAGVRDQAIDARNPFAGERGEGQTRRIRWSVSGPLVKNRTSVALNLSTRDAFDVQPIVAARPGGTINEAATQRNRRFDGTVRVEHALTAAHTLRVEYQHRSGGRDNLGVGEFNLPERAYDTDSRRHLFRVSDIGTLGKRAFNELRLQVFWNRDERYSHSDEVTVDVANAFTSGGAQLGGGTRTVELELRNDLEIAVNERHRLRLGFDAEAGRVRSDRVENASGRFSFPSLDAYLEGRPIQFVQRIGDPSLAYSRYELSWYVTDEIRLRKDVQLGVGLRHQLQSFTRARANFGPRASVAWTPGVLPGTTIRAGGGLFHRWYDASLHEQTLRLDGTRQRDLIVMDPGWPDPLADGGFIALPPPSVVRASPDLQLPTSRRVSVGVEQPVADGIQVRANVFDESGWHQLRSLDVNAPVDGVRPQPDLARVTEIRSIAGARQRGFEVSLRARPDGGRLFGTATYRYARRFNEADGPLALPADSANLAAEWGPAGNDIRHRIFGYLRLRLPHGLGVGLSARGSSGVPYTIRTGFDDNRDGVLNDRPAGVGRNSARGSWQALADLRLGWTVGGRNGWRSRQAERNRDDAAPRGAEIYAQVSNLFNTTSFTRYSGVLTSPYFGQPTAALPARRMELGLRVFF